MGNSTIALGLGAVLWSVLGWLTFPRELWDVGAFWMFWGLAVLFAGALGLSRASRPFLDTALLFAPMIGVLTVTTLLTGGSASLLPLGLIAVLVLALPGWVLARAARRLRK